MVEAAHDIGIVAIGRNEGDRLRQCLGSMPRHVPLVYVDSGSTDGSVALARSMGAEVVALDLARPFTAARARNEGYARLLERWPHLAFVQFIDGDCELEPGWLPAAKAFLSANADVAAACGRRRERFPDASRYNRWCDDEWNTAVGESLACGGDAMFRVQGLIEVDGYDGTIIAGEEPELCQRLRVAGWRIWRLDLPMTIHDAAMYRLKQWWLRAVRSGFGYAQTWAKTRAGAGDAIYGRQVASALIWTVGVLAVAGLCGIVAGPVGLLAGPVIWLIQLCRLSRRVGLNKAAHLLVSKIAETLGILRYGAAAARGRRHGAIIYK